MNIVIIGASAAGHSLAAFIRQRNKDNPVTLLTEEKFPFYDRRRLPELIQGGIKEKNIFLSSEEFYSQNNIIFLKEKKAVNLNPNKKIIYFKDGEKNSNLAYDALVICTGRRFERSDAEGARKTGVFTFYSLEDYKDLSAYLMGDTFAIAGTGPLALKIAGEMSKKNKEVKLIGPSINSAQPLPQGVELIDSEIVEMIGESETQAVRLKEGKIIGVSAVIFAAAQKSNVEFLKGLNLEMTDDLILVDDGSQTSLPGVYALGSVCRNRNNLQEEKNWDSIIKEADFLAERLSKA